MADQLKEVLPVVLGHEPEESEEGPAEGVKAGVAVVGVPPRLYTLVALRTLPVDTTPTGQSETRLTLSHLLPDKLLNNPQLKRKIQC